MEVQTVRKAHSRIVAAAMTDTTYYIEEAAAFVGLNVSTLQARAKQGIVPS